MFSIAKKSTTQVGEFLVGFCFLAIISTSVSAAEYRLFVNDQAACSSAGKTGSVCVVEIGETTPSTVTPTTVTPTTSPPAVVTTSTDDDCVVSTWEDCGGDGAASPGTVSSETSAPSGGTVAGGNLDFGSGGSNAGVKTYPVTVTNDIIAYPFTTIQGAYYGTVVIVPTSKPFPDDGTEVRMWWSKTAGGQPLAGAACSGNLGREGSRYWDQSGTRGYGCTIDNTAATLFLNLQACISTANDTTCSAAGAAAGSPAPIYLQGRLNEAK